MLSIATIAFGQYVQVPKISATGVARTFVVPDTLSWSVEVRFVAPRPADAIARASEVARAVETYLVGLDIPRSKVQTSNVSISVHNKRDGDQWIKDGHEATIDLGFELNDLALYGAILQKLSEFSEVSISETAWSYSRQIEVLEQTRDEALRAARRKAERMAAVLNARIGAPILIADEGSSVGSYSFRAASSYTGNYAGIPDGEDDGETGIIPAQGRIPVRARVEVQFELISTRQAEPGATDNLR